MGKFDLSFSKIAPVFFDNKWIIGVDSVPFEIKDDDLTLKNGKKPVLLYYIEYHPRNAVAVRESTVRY
jgi:hypothetical protein